MTRSSSPRSPTSPRSAAAPNSSASSGTPPASASNALAPVATTSSAAATNAPISPPWTRWAWPTAPEDEALARAELSASLHFAALLEPAERDVFRCQLDGPRDKPLGATKIARALDRPLSEVRNAERAIEIKYERFATIYAAGRLCGYLAPAVAALAAGDDDAHAADSGRELAARVHLEVERCPTCTADYARQLRYLQGARFHHQVAALLPATASSERVRGLGGGVRDWLPDWAARLLAHEPAGSAAQLAAGGAGRGARHRGRDQARHLLPGRRRDPRSVRRHRRAAPGPQPGAAAGQRSTDAAAEPNPGQA